MLARALELAPCDIGTRSTLAHVAFTNGEFARQAELLRSGFESCPPHDGLHNAYAYALATSLDTDGRDGAKAVQIAEQVVSRQPSESPEFLDTLAVAYAEAGRFDDAVRVGKRALALFEAKGEPVGVEASREHLALFEARRPVRE